MSVLPLFLLLLSVFQSVYFNNNRGKKDFSSNNTSELTEKEWERMSVYMSRSYLVAVPLFIQFIIFFDSPAKVLSVLVFFAAFCGGGIYFRVKHKDERVSRFDKETKELEEQRRNEELGKWK